MTEEEDNRPCCPGYCDSCLVSCSCICECDEFEYSCECESEEM